MSPYSRCIAGDGCDATTETVFFPRGVPSTASKDNTQLFVMCDLMSDLRLSAEDPMPIN